MSTFVVDVPSTIKGRASTTPIRVTHREEGPDHLSFLVIESEYSRRDDTFRKTDCYEVEEFACTGDFDGRGFRLRKGVDVYDVFLARNGQDHTCDCRGFCAHGHCKHVEAVKASVAEIPNPLHRPEYDLPPFPYPGFDPFVDEVP